MGTSAAIDTPEFLQNAVLLLAAAGFVIPAFARVRISPVIGFILIGICIGPYGLLRLADQLPVLRYLSISDPAAIAPMAKAGIILLLFSIGLELSLGRMKRMRRAIFGLGSAELLGCAALIMAGLLITQHNMASALILGLALALSSTAIVLPISGTTSSVGRAALAMLLFEDLALVPILLGIGLLAAVTIPDPLTLALAAGKGALLIAAMMGAGLLLLPRLFAQAARTKSPELFLSASLLVIIAGAAFGGWVGIGATIGALIAGVLIAETPYRQEIELTIAPIKGLALGVFLISVGMALDLSYILDNAFALIASLVGILIVKALVTGALLRWSGARAGVSAETGLLMASPSETTLIVLGAATSAGLLSVETSQFWQIVTAMGLTITPILARIGHDIARRIEWRSGATAPAIPTSPQATVIIGYGRVGRLIADMLDRHHQPWRAIEVNIDSVTAARRRGEPVSFGDIGKTNVLKQLALDQAKAIVITMDDPAQQVRLTRLVRAEYPDLTIISRARDGEHAAALYKAGASDAVPETFESSLQLSEAVLVDLGLAMGPVIASIHERRDEMRRDIMAMGDLDAPPKLSPARKR
jgi:monovalent cation:H+ antiporter-2, CPA2 family